MQTAKTKKTFGHTSKVGRSIERGDFRERQDGNTEARTIDAAGTGPALHLLEKELQPVTFLEMSLRSGHKNHWYQCLLKTIDTEEKMLTAIEDLYAIVKAQPKYKNLKEPNWKESDRPLDVLLWLLRKLSPLANGDLWTVDTYQLGNKTRYRFIVFRNFHSQKLQAREEYISLDFLPGLRKRDKPLHDLIIDLVALVSRENKIPVWDEDGDFSKAKDEFLTSENIRTHFNSLLDTQKYSYSKGPAALYLRYIKQRRKKVTIQSIKDLMKKYKDKSQRKRSVIWWIELGLRIAKTQKCIEQFSFVPNFLLSSNPVTPFRLYKFIWSSHGHDIVSARAMYNINRDDKKGFILPVMFSVAKPGQQITKVNEDNWPERLYEFMRWMVSHTRWTFKDYYYKKQLEEQKTPMDTMLEQIEKNEIKNWFENE